MSGRFTPERLAMIEEFLERPENAGKSNRAVGRELDEPESAIRRVKAMMAPEVKATVVTLKLSAIIPDPEIQPRARMDDAAIADLESAYASGADVPRMSVWKTPDGNLMADGFHRFAGADRAGVEELEVDLYEGTRADAVAFAVRANCGSKAVRWTNEDKARSVRLMLADPTLCHWSDGRIADHCGVTDVTVGRYRKAANPNIVGVEPEKRVGLDGKERKVKPASPRPNPNIVGVEWSHVEVPDDEIGENGRVDFEDKADSEEEWPEDAVVGIHGLSPPGPSPAVKAALERQNGKLPHAKPELAGDEPEPPKVLSDPEWLATLPGREKLTGRTRAIFDGDATAYRHVFESPHFVGIAALAKAEKRARRGNPQTGEFLYRLDVFVSIPHPRSWLVCSACTGAGCEQCRRRGYVVS